MFAVVAFALVAQTPLVMDGLVPDDDSDFFELTFEVPAGTAEIEIVHEPTDDEDILDWGVFNPDGSFRGYGGGTRAPAIIGASSSSTSYLPGPIEPGTWTIYVGKAKLLSAAPGYHVEITLRETATLAPVGDRAAWAEPAPLSTEARFYAGDFHVHSEDSGDADATLDEIGVLALDRALDFVVITDHNTTSHVDRLAAAQERAAAGGGRAGLFFVPGVEFTTYDGHATGFGARRFVDHRIGVGGRTIQDAVDEVLAQEGTLFSINHPALDLGDVCIGCAWTHDDPDIGTVAAVEIQTGRTLIFADAAIAFWESLLDRGHHVAAIGGSDDHNAGRENAAIGEPTTLVFSAQGLTLAGLREGILASRTVVKMQGPDDPMVVLDTNPPRQGDTAVADTVILTATVTGGVGKTFRFVQNGLGVALPADITEDPQVFTLEVTPDATGNQRFRAETADPDGAFRTITSYVWVRAGPEISDCRCNATRHDGERAELLAGFPVWVVGCLALIYVISMIWRRSYA